MPPKGGNAKAESGRAKKAANADKKAAEAAAKAEAEEASKWDKGAKGKGAADAKAEKAAEAAKKKAEKAALLAEEEANLPDKPVKKAPTGKKANAERKAESKAPAGPTGIDDALQSLSASNIDDALDALSIATEKTDKASQGTKAAQLERHPERRFKAAFEAFKEREMDRIKQERPGMRSQQYHDALYKEFQKHPDNPFNQLTVAYDATKEEKLAALKGKKDAVEKRLAG
ncbi:DUF1014-domain-containing protein [Acaromyces ingoldii]|uniref:DUF1014-domain-containing protein n=1 Tax=Acaromyces ingoldii TaxID=215250 RepID=A0A316YYB4_9BASI|nr:DUF1014-domain-containing protein [Acaromyces ingoldii]PWN93754.1 DUF1014-domain-containing protein [Acaromyces ingoldii]